MMASNFIPLIPRSKRRGCLILLGFLLHTGVSAAAEPSGSGAKSGWRKVNVTRRYDPAAKSTHFNIKSLRLDANTVIDEKDGSIHLAGSVLFAHETGATDYRQTERLSNQVHVKKIFELQDDEIAPAELFFYGTARQIDINGVVMPSAVKLVSTGWRRLPIPVERLLAGKNEIIFRDGGQLLLEPGRTGFSFKSRDGGKTWSRAGMTAKANQSGEYLVRLRTACRARRGEALSPVVDLWTLHAKEIARPSHNVYFGDMKYLNNGQPPGTHIAAWIRTGATPAPDESNWSQWISLDRKYVPKEKAHRHRWAQYKLELSTKDAQATPRLQPGLEFRYEIERAKIGNGVEVVAAPPSIPKSSVLFTYQKPSPRLRFLRERYKLDKVIAPGKTEMEKLMLLRHWVRNQWHTAWGGHPSAWMPPWDAHIILASKDQPDCLTMCTHYAAVYTQCCLALGWNARHCILDHHCVAEVYVQEFDKWVMMDAGNSRQRADVTLHFEKNKIPMSARELHLAYRSGKTAGIELCFTPPRLRKAIAGMCRPAPPAKEKTPPAPERIGVADLDNFPVCGLANYRRYAMPARNNYLDSLLPGELYQGWSSYFYDGYRWVGDSVNRPTISPEYSLHIPPARVHEADWKLNWTRIYLQQTEKPGVLRVILDTHTPNFKRFERTILAGTKKVQDNVKTAREFDWQLQRGLNTLRVRSVNYWDKRGTFAEVIVSWPKPPRP